MKKLVTVLFCLFTGLNILSADIDKYQCRANLKENIESKKFFTEEDMVCLSYLLSGEDKTNPSNQDKLTKEISSLIEGLAAFLEQVKLIDINNLEQFAELLKNTDPLVVEVVLEFLDEDRRDIEKSVRKAKRKQAKKDMKEAAKQFGKAIKEGWKAIFN